MNLQLDVTKIKETLEKSQDVLIVTHEHPTYDSMGGALALYLGLIGLGKKVTIACPEAITVELSRFVGINKVVSEVANKNFIVSLDYIEGSIEKVSYNIEGDKFNLVIEPRPGFPPFSEQNVHYRYQGASFDTIFTVDTIHLGGLKKLYDQDKDLFASKPIINIDRHPNNSLYGTVNIVDGRVSTTSELIAHVLASLGTKLTVDIATNLLNAVIVATNNFQIAGVSAYTFDLASTCMKAGAKRFGDIHDEKRPQSVEPKAQTSKNQPRVQGEPIEPIVMAETPATTEPAVSQEEKTTSDHHEPSTPVIQASTIEGQVKEGAPQSEDDRQREVSQKVTEKQEAPADWLRPKIFKSSTLS